MKKNSDNDIDDFVRTLRSNMKSSNMNLGKNKTFFTAKNSVVSALSGQAGASRLAEPK